MWQKYWPYPPRSDVLKKKTTTTRKVLLYRETSVISMPT
jgi:hypothetical protein